MKPGLEIVSVDNVPHLINNDNIFLAKSEFYTLQSSNFIFTLQKL